MAEAPNDKIGELVSVLGEADTRELVGIYLESVPASMKELTGADLADCTRAAHSLKSSSRQMGVAALATRMAALEKRLREEGGSVTAEDLAGAAADFAAAEGSLRAFLNPA